MTSIELLMDKLGLSIETHRKAFEQAKEMHKQEIIDAHISGYDSSGGSAEDYYNYYYGSKGSDETLKD